MTTSCNFAIHSNLRVSSESFQRTDSLIAFEHSTLSLILGNLSGIREYDDAIVRASVLSQASVIQELLSLCLPHVVDAGTQQVLIELLSERIVVDWSVASNSLVWC